jgi:hypothetical protein
MKGEQGDQWNRATVKIGNVVADQFAIIFEAERDIGYSGDIALDDMSFVNCARSKSMRNYSKIE